MLRRLNLILLFLFLMMSNIPLKTQNEPIRNRTIKKIVPVDKVSSPYYAIQILALKDAPNDAVFFENIESAREFSCADGYKRYVVGRFETQAQAQAELAKIRAKSPKYAKSFVVNTENFQISTSSINSNYSDENPTEPNLDRKNDKFSALRTGKKIIPVDAATAPYFAIQLLALRNAPQDASFFENVDAAREFNCKDGFARYVFGQYETYEDAMEDLPKTRSLSIKYKQAFVVNTSNFSISSTAFNKEFNQQSEGNVSEDFGSDISSLRTNKRIIPIDQLNPEEYSVQVLALKELPKNAEFFGKLDVVKEVSCKDGFKRYLVGPFKTADEARLSCENIRKLGDKYKNAFIISNQKLQVDAAMFTAKYEEPAKTQLSNQGSQVKVSAPINAVKKESVNQNDNSETLVTIEDKTTVPNNNKTIVNDAAYSETLKNNAARANEAKLATPKVISTEKGEYVKTGSNNLVDSNRQLTADEKAEVSVPVALSSNRTEKKIIPVDKAVKPFYTIQVLALKDAPHDPLFFDNIETAREFSCTDGYKRYVVGQYETREQAAADVERVRGLSPKYKNAFVANTANYDISLDDFRKDYSAEKGSKESSVKSDNFENAESIEDETSPQKSALNKLEKSSAEKISNYDPNKIYTIQLTASRYPFYVSELKEFKEVYEFFMPDKVYRYTVGKYTGSQIDAEIKKVISFGYNEAFAVEYDKYLPYKIE